MDYQNNSYVSDVISTQTFNTNTWYQITVVYDTTQAVAANRIKLFVDGQQITSFARQLDPSQNFAGATGSAGARYLGQNGGTSEDERIRGDLADAQFVDGQALNASAFGTSVNGQWEPIAYSGSYGTNGYHLTFASGGIGTDVSGNGDNFTPVNLSNANVVSTSPGGSSTQVALTLDNGVPFNGGSSDPIAGATVHLTGGFANDGDLLSANTSGTNVTANWNATSETLTLSGSDTAAHYQALFDNLVFSSGAADPSNGAANPTRTATWQVTDATNNQLSAAQTETIDISPAYAQGAGQAQGASPLVFSDTASQGGGSVVIADGNSVELTYSASLVSFIASTGTLQLDNSARFTGSVSGFAAQDQIDLRDIVFGPQTSLGYAANSGNTGGTLTVGNSGDSANIVFVRSYTASQFAIPSDGHGGTLLTAQGPVPSEQASLATPRTHA